MKLKKGIIRNLLIGWIFIMPLLLFGDDYRNLPALQSVFFEYKYEADSLLPTELPANMWRTEIRKPTVLNFSRGILFSEYSSLRLYKLRKNFLNKIDHASGWTYEIKLRVVNQTGTGGAIAMTVDDREGSDGGINGLQIHVDKTQWSRNQIIADSTMNSDQFHTYRLAEAANSDTVYFWKDGIYKGKFSETASANSTSLYKHLLLGSHWTTIDGRVAVDYMRWDASGAYQPGEKYLKIHANTDAKINESGKTSHDYQLTLKQKPESGVNVSVYPCFGDTAGVLVNDANSSTLIFTQDNWEIPQTITVKAINDEREEWIHDVTIRHKCDASDSLFDQIDETYKISISDNDKLLKLSENIRTLSISEKNTTSDTFQIQCGVVPKNSVTISMNYNSDKFIMSPESLILDDQNYNQIHDIVVTAIDDNAMDRLVHYPIKFQLSSQDDRFDNYKLPAARVKLFNNDRKHDRKNNFSIPVVDLDQDYRQSIVDKESGQYLGHPTTTMLPDSQTILTVYPEGHGRGAIRYRKSVNGGLTWGGMLETPDNWSSSKEVPTIFKMTDSLGVERLIMFSGLYPARRAYSEDYGKTWTPLEKVGDWGGIVVMGCATRLKNGHYMAMFHDDGRFFTENGSASDTFKVYKTYSEDGGLSWSDPETVIECDWAQPCEPGIFRSPDGNQLLVLLRENSRQYNSFYITSDDEGDSWSDIQELPAALTGDRHTGIYLPDGRLFISFRDMAHETPTKGDWVGWIGSYQDIFHERQGQYRLLIKDNLNSWDAAYPGVDLLPDGTVVTTTYGHWDGSSDAYVVSSRFKAQEIDYLAENDVRSTLSPDSYKILVLSDIESDTVKSFTKILGEDLPKAGIEGEIISVGNYNINSTDALSTLQSVVIAEEPDIVLLQLGRNDAHVDLTDETLQPTVSLTEFSINIEKIINRLSDENIRVVLMTPSLMCWNNQPDKGTLETYGADVENSPYELDEPLGVNNVLDNYVEIVRNIAIDKQVDYINIFSRFYNYCKHKEVSFNELLSNGLLPNKLGHQLIAQEIFEYFDITIPDNELPEKASVDFSYRYEANQAPPKDEVENQWMIPFQSPTNIQVKNGILTAEFIGGASVDQMWRLHDKYLDSLDHQKGWTVEIRLKVLRQDKERGAIAINIDDRTGTAGGMGGIQIHENKTQWTIDRETADDNSNTNQYHVFRLAQVSFSDETKCWRDGKYLGKNRESFAFSQNLLDKYILFGSWSNRLGGKVAIDYIRWDKSGAYAPSPETKINTDASQNPQRFKLYQNYPNPFNPRTAIAFDINKPSFCKLEIVNLKGETIKLLLSENMQPGSYEKIWNGTNQEGEKVSSGIYLYKLHTNREMKNKKMLFIK